MVETKTNELQQKGNGTGIGADVSVIFQLPNEKTFISSLALHGENPIEIARIIKSSIKFIKHHKSAIIGAYLYAQAIGNDKTYHGLKREIMQLLDEHCKEILDTIEESDIEGYDYSSLQGVINKEFKTVNKQKSFIYFYVIRFLEETDSRSMYFKNKSDYYYYFDDAMLKLSNYEQDLKLGKLESVSDYYEMYSLYIQYENFEKALSILNVIIDKFPSFSDAYIDKGALLKKIGKDDELLEFISTLPTDLKNKFILGIFEVINAGFRVRSLRDMMYDIMSGKGVDNNLFD